MLSLSYFGMFELSLGSSSAAEILSLSRRLLLATQKAFALVFLAVIKQR
jgi:hypothetical protein